MATLSDCEKTVRRIRKKLRQIEHLQALTRDLNEEEAQKIATKDSLRLSLSQLLLAMKRKSDEGLEPSLENDLNEVEERSRSNGERSNRAKKQCIEKKTATKGSLNQEQQLEITLPTTTSSLQDCEPSSSTDTVQVRVSTPSKVRSKVRVKKDHWRQNKSFLVHTLEGHEDLVLDADVDIGDDVAVTTSRDTTALVWSISSHEEIASLRGHTGFITCTTILPKTANQNLSYPSKMCLSVTGSLDCALKLWDTKAGKQLKSIYTYNGIKCCAYSQQAQVVFTGTDGGKIEAFDMQKSHALASVSGHDDAVTGVDCRGDLLCSGDRRGLVKVWKVDKDQKGKINLTCLYISDHAEPASEDLVSHQRCILAIKIVSPNLIAFGDSGCNVKILDWKTNRSDGAGVLHKLPNHTTEVGFTDCITTVNDDILLTSSFDVDSGLGHVNIFLLRGDELPTYICSLTDEETSRIFGLGASMTPEDNQLTFVTSGREVKMWKTWLRGKTDLPQEDCVLVQPTVMPLYSDEVVDSGSSSDEEDEEEEEQRRRVRRVRVEEEEQKSGWSCNIL